MNVSQDKINRLRLVDFQADFKEKNIRIYNKIYDKCLEKGLFSRNGANFRKLASFIDKTFWKDKFSKKSTKYSKLFEKTFGEKMTSFEECFVLDLTETTPSDKTLKAMAKILFSSDDKVYLDIIRLAYNKKTNGLYPSVSEFNYAIFSISRRGIVKKKAS